MNSFYILQNTDKDPDGEVTGRIAEYLRSKGANVVNVRDGAEVRPNADAVIVLGGDGTVLRAARRIVGTGLPLVGINLGSLGYLAEIQKDAYRSALDRLLRDEIRIEERMMLTGRVLRGGKMLAEHIALNDIVISRSGPLRIMCFENYVNGEPLSTFKADGVIIATPTGSTGYSLSAGGPIVSPTASLILITAVAPHTINTRSVILSPTDRISITVSGSRHTDEAAAVSFDGEDAVVLSTGDSVEAEQAQVRTRLIRLTDMSFLDILRHKMQLT